MAKEFIITMIVKRTTYMKKINQGFYTRKASYLHKKQSHDRKWTTFNIFFTRSIQTLHGYWKWYRLGCLLSVKNIHHMLRLRIPLNIKAKNNKVVVRKKRNMWYDEAHCLAKINTERGDRMIWRCASKLRNDIFVVQDKKICDPVTIYKIKEGEAIPLYSLKSFFKMLCKGKFSATVELSLKKSQLNYSSAVGSVFCYSASKLFSAKQVSLGLALKSMPGSEKVLTLMNYYCHCASSKTMQKVDIALELTLRNWNSFITNGIKTMSNLATGTAWDNFDIALETLSGRDTIHHTYGR